jgi:predicted membrane protein
MEFKDIKDAEKKDDARRGSWDHRGGRVAGGLLIVAIGAALFLERMGYLFPSWLFTWPMILILVGLFTGIRSRFRFFGWIVLCGIGTLFLMQEIYTTVNIDRLIWPIVLITIGLSVMFGRQHTCFGPHRIKKKLRDKWGDDWQEKWEKQKKERAYWHERAHWQDWKKQMYDPGYTSNAGDLLDINAVFGSIKRTVLSKNFKGGEINTVLGGCELNLTQADIVGTAIIEINTVLGGTRIIVPPTWQVSSEMDSVFGSLEDKRPIQLLSPNPDKVLILKGASVFGGTELSLG